MFTRPRQGIFGTDNPHGTLNIRTAQADVILTVAAAALALAGYRKAALGVVGGAAAGTLGRVAWIKLHQENPLLPLADAIKQTGLSPIPKTQEEFFAVREGVKSSIESSPHFTEIKTPAQWLERAAEVDKAIRRAYLHTLLHIGWLQKRQPKKNQRPTYMYILRHRDNRLAFSHLAKLYHLARNFAADGTDDLQWVKNAVRIKKNKVESRKLAQGPEGKKFYQEGTLQNSWRLLFNDAGRRVRKFFKEPEKWSLGQFFQPDRNRRFPLRILDGVLTPKQPSWPF